MSMKQIDFDTLCRICRHGYIKIGKFNCSHKDNEKKMTTTVDCPIWNSLLDVEPEKKKTLPYTREPLTWLEYEGY